MSATLIAVVVALVLGHLAQSLAASVRDYSWYRNWLRWLDARLSTNDFWRGRWGLVIALVPPLLAVGLFQLALHEPLWGLAGLAFAIAVLFYAWGPRDLDLDVEAIAGAGDPVSRRAAASRLWPEGEMPATLDGASLIEAVFRNAQQRWFGVLFWFLLLGPVGALLYRFTVLAAQGEASAELPVETRLGARKLLALLDWPVAQLMTLSLALVGNFDTVLGAWREAGGASFDLDRPFLGAVARASVKCELAEEAADYASDNGGSVEVGEGGVPALPAIPPAWSAELPELRDAMSLVWRSLLVWLAVLALFVIAGWVS
ncbi:cobalamin biosynthesis protein [Lysobacter arenosi]|uniref:Cobalamin biosynthesis protein n=1 Tax=Lysobacter arenosi TaxID=2795387 RepID=A0ABX7R9U0_9GAMM|nr:cobalamin biosynthesis protein [Lysobacter arenosi]QSX74760.1 cobalamin biosynthesis protein [Lysobacter arenosi]